MTKIRSTDDKRVQDNRAQTKADYGAKVAASRARAERGQAATARNAPKNPGLFPKTTPKSTVSPPGAPGRAKPVPGPKKTPSYRKTGPR